jgi:hypothetical protein
MTLEVRVQAREAFTGAGSVLLSEKGLILDHQFLQGSAWIRETKNYKLQTPYGEITSLRGDFFIEYTSNRVRVVNNLGVLKVALKDGRAVEVPMGFEFWFSEIQLNKQNLMGFIQPVDLKDHIEILGKLWSASPQDLKVLLLEFQDHWGDRAAQAARYDKSLALRHIASIEAAKEYKRDLKRQEASRRKANQKLLYQHAFER